MRLEVGFLLHILSTRRCKVGLGLLLALSKTLGWKCYVSCRIYVFYALYLPLNKSEWLGYPSRVPQSEVL